MTRDEARALIARAANHEAGRQRGLTDRDDWEEITEQERGGWLLLAGAVLDALFAGGGEEYRVVDKDGDEDYWTPDASSATALRASLDRTDPASAPHRVQSRRTVTLVGEWEDENDG